MCQHANARDISVKGIHRSDPDAARLSWDFLRAAKPRRGRECAALAKPPRRASSYPARVRQSRPRGQSVRYLFNIQFEISNKLRS